MIAALSDILPGLAPASFRGVPFFVPDARSEVGRRVAEYLFPGIDRAAYDDFGLLPAIVTVSGILVGDDYVARAAALQAALERPGPGLLVHPWFGPMQVILTEPAELSFSASELRVARFEISFKRFDQSGAVSSGSSVHSVLTATAGLASTALMLAASVDRVVSSVRTLAVGRAWRMARDIWPQGGGPATALAADELRGATPASARELHARFAAASAAIAHAVRFASERPAVSASAEAVTAPSVEAGAAVDVLLSVAAGLAEADQPSSVDRALALAAASDALSAAGSVSGEIEPESRREAVALRIRFSDLVDTIAAGADRLTEPLFAAAARNLVAACEDLRSAISTDINEAIGRLPDAVVIEAVTDVDAFAIANHLYGDRPETLLAGYRSIVARNRPRHPAHLPAGRIEALR